MAKKTDGTATGETTSWRRLFADAVRDPAELGDIVGLVGDDRTAAVDAAKSFALTAPRGFVAKIDVADRNDPLLLQILPTAGELTNPPGFVGDPLHEASATVVPGLLRKYQSRALLIVSGTCAINCRYCFRRTYPYDQTPADVEAWQPALDAIAADAAIDEVILSGGDPLTRTDAWLERLVAKIRTIDHVRRLRVHTRTPIVLPERVTDELIAWLTAAADRQKPVMVVHSNHAREIGPEVLVALRKISQAEITLLNQAVLLRGINDDARVLADLSHRLFEAGCLPYYLHQLDRVAGTSHFEVPSARGIEIMSELRTMLPGYLVPKYVQELPGEPSKTPVA